MGFVFLARPRHTVLTIRRFVFRYEVYLEKQLSRDAKAKLRKSKDKEKSAADEPWFGVEDELRRIQEKKEAEGEGSSSDDSDSEDDEHEGSDSDGDEMDVDDDEDAEEVKVEARRETQGDEKLSRRAKLFFENPLFKDVLGSLEEGRKTESRKGDASSTKKRSRIDLSDEETEKPKKAKKRDTKVIGAGDESSDEEFIKNARKNRKELRKKGKAARKEDSDDEKSDSEGGNKQTFEVVPAEPDPELSGDEDDPEILATPQAITAALALARGGRKAKRDIIDASFNRYAFNDQKGALPRWFLDDEGKHNKPQLPISKEAVQVIRARARQLDARPIKKIAEAKGRKKLRALKRIQKLKSEMGKIWEDNDPGTTELQKARAIQKLAEKAAKGKGTNSKKEKPKLVVAKGFAKGVKGRPKGVKGRYKMVDGRMKKELRAQKRIAKAGKAKRRR